MNEREEAFRRSIRSVELYSDAYSLDDLFELTREILHALADDLEDNESYAVNGIARFRDAANSIPDDKEYFDE